MIKKIVNCWRYGQLSSGFVYLFRVGVILLLSIPVWLVWENNHFTQDRLVLIDILLGLPLGFALWLTMVIVWQGLVKTIACFSGRMIVQFPEEMSEVMRLIDRDIAPIEKTELEEKTSALVQKEAKELTDHAK